MKKKVRFVGVAALVLALTQSLQATPITGNIWFTGGVNLNDSSAADATGVASWITPTVNLPPTGSFADIASGSRVQFTSSTWYFNTSTPIENFWKVGGFTFELLSSYIVSQGGAPGAGGFVVVSGMGIVSANGYTPTPMSWSFTGEDQPFGGRPNSWTLSVLANSIPPKSVPDGGATVLLLGIALSGVALLRKKLAA